MSTTQTLERAGILTAGEFTQTPSAGELVSGGVRERLARRIMQSAQREEEKSAMESFLLCFKGRLVKIFHLDCSIYDVDVEKKAKELSRDEIDTILELFYHQSVKRVKKWALGVISCPLLFVFLFLFTPSPTPELSLSFLLRLLGSLLLPMATYLFIEMVMTEAKYPKTYRKLKKFFGKDTNEKIYEAIHGKTSA